MALLFKSASARRSHKITKHQVGGTIPYYPTYQVTPLVQSKYDPSALLEKYKDTAPTKAAAGDSKDKEELKPFETVGLSIDGLALSEDINTIQQEINYGFSHHSDFGKTDKYAKLIAQHNHLSTTGLNENKNQQDRYNKNLEVLINTQHGDKQWAYTNGVGYFKTPVLDEENKPTGKYKVENLTPEEAKDENGDWKYKPLTYGELAIERDQNPELRGRLDVIEDLKNGMNLTYVKEKFIDPAFKDIGYGKGGYDNKSGGYYVNGAVIKSVLNAGSTKSNDPNLKAALSQLRTDLQGSKAWDALMAQAWSSYIPDKDKEGKEIFRPVKTETEAIEKVNKYLVLELAKRSQVETDSKTEQMYDFKNTMEMMGGGGGGASGKDKASNIAAETTQEMHDINLERYIPGSNKKNQMLTVKGVDAPWVKKELNENQSLALNDVLNTAAFLEDARLLDAQGTKLKNMKISFAGGGGNYNGLTGAMLAKGTKVDYVMTPVNKKTGAVLTRSFLNTKGYKDKIAAVDAKFKSMGKGPDDKDCVAAKEKVLNAYKTKTDEEYTIEPSYIMTVVYQKDALENGAGPGMHTVFSQGKTATSDISHILNPAKKGGFSEAIEEAWIPYTGNEQKDFIEVKVRIPARDRSMLQQAGKGGQKISTPTTYTTGYKSGDQEIKDISVGENVAGTKKYKLGGNLEDIIK